MHHVLLELRLYRHHGGHQITTHGIHCAVARLLKDIPLPDHVGDLNSLEFLDGPLLYFALFIYRIF